MKIKRFFSLVLLYIPVLGYSQLTVDSSGRVITGTSTVPYWKVGLQNSIITTDNTHTVSVYGKGEINSPSAISWGIYGYANNSYSGGYGYGVFGKLDNLSMNGAAVMGSLSPVSAPYVVGTYAGYFIGNTKISGTLTATSVVQTSDLRLKENIVPLNLQRGSILDKVSNMNTIEYNYKSILPSLNIPDSLTKEEVVESIGFNPAKKHIGLIAQELQELFPELVEEGQDGYLGVNYMELVPVLVCAIQELKAQIDELRGNTVKSIAKTTSTTNIRSQTTAGNFLYQNTPNPFNEQTVIRFKLSDNTQNANICIFDMQGKMLKNIPVSSAMESISISGSEIGKGLFLYSLVVNGQEIDTKRMVISK